MTQWKETTMQQEIEELVGEIERLQARRDALYRDYIRRGGGELYDRVHALDASIGDMEYRLRLLCRGRDGRCGYRRRPFRLED